MSRPGRVSGRPEVAGRLTPEGCEVGGVAGSADVAGSIAVTRWAAMVLQWVPRSQSWSPVRRSVGLRSTLAGPADRPLLIERRRYIRPTSCRHRPPASDENGIDPAKGRPRSGGFERRWRPAGAPI